jgi:hypothetical protein
MGDGFIFYHVDVYCAAAAGAMSEQPTGKKSAKINGGNGTEHRDFSAK